MNGNVASKIQYSKGLEHGKTTYYSADQKITKIMNYENGVLHGSSKNFWEFGNLQSSVNYENGKIEGECEKYYPAGTLREKNFIKDGHSVGLDQAFYDNGVLLYEKFWENGSLNGKFVHNWKNGNLMEEGFKVNHKWHGVHKTGYESGRLDEWVEYSHGNHCGKRQTWWDHVDEFGEPIKKCEEFYTDEFVLHGVRKKWYENGQFEIDEAWVNGVRMSAKSYHRSGKLELLDYNRVKPKTCIGFHSNGQPSVYTIYYDTPIEEKTTP